jgi:hypothetical protein
VRKKKGKQQTQKTQPPPPPYSTSRSVIKSRSGQYVPQGLFSFWKRKAVESLQR